MDSKAKPSSWERFGAALTYWLCIPTDGLIAPALMYFFCSRSSLITKHAKTAFKYQFGCLVLLAILGGAALFLEQYGEASVLVNLLRLACSVGFLIVLLAKIVGPLLEGIAILCPKSVNKDQL